MVEVCGTLKPNRFPMATLSTNDRLLEMAALGILDSSHYTTPGLSATFPDRIVEGLPVTLAQRTAESTTRKPKPGFTRGSARCYLRGRCFSEIERMISLPLPALTNGGSACASAASSNS
jgi:hypothetical protein